MSSDNRSGFWVYSFWLCICLRSDYVQWCYNHNTAISTACIFSVCYALSSPRVFPLSVLNVWNTLPLLSSHKCFWSNEYILVYVLIYIKMDLYLMRFKVSFNSKFCNTIATLWWLLLYSRNSAKYLLYKAGVTYICEMRNLKFRKVNGNFKPSVDWEVYFH